MSNNRGIKKAKDNSFKVIFSNPEFFVEFIRDFVDIDILKDIKPEDIEDISERFLPLFQEGKDSDTVKRINISGEAPLFVIAILEHQSKVNFRTSFKMLQYISLVLDNYEKEAEKHEEGITTRKSFRYPPVLPIVYYDGPGRWTAETNFFDKTELNEIFGKYIPKFEYEVINLNKYSHADLMTYEDMLSLILLLDKCVQASDFNKISSEVVDYYKKLPLNETRNNTKMLIDVTKTLLAHINVPRNEIDKFADEIHEGRQATMFEPLKKYDVQETRRVARSEGRAEIHDESPKAFIALGRGKSIEDVARELEMPISDVQKIKDSLATVLAS
jgi:hypothetical protein